MNTSLHQDHRPCSQNGDAGREMEQGNPLTSDILSPWKEELALDETLNKSKGEAGNEMK
jgi:hypothetical protein